jgi:hypothetical protein
MKHTARFDKFNVVGVSTSVNYTQKWITKFYNNFKLLLEVANRLNDFNESRYHKFLPGLTVNRNETRVVSSYPHRLLVGKT